MFIAFDKDEFDATFSDEWYDKRWHGHTVRWNGKGRQWRFLETENRCPQAIASDDIEPDSDDDESSLQEEAWNRMVGNKCLEGMRRWHCSATASVYH